MAKQKLSVSVCHNKVVIKLKAKLSPSQEFDGHDEPLSPSAKGGKEDSTW